MKAKEFNILPREITVDKKLGKFLYLSAHKVLSELSSALLPLILSRCYLGTKQVRVFPIPVIHLDNYLDMSNTGRDKKLASFNCDEGLWDSFKSRCQEKGTTATATLTRFIQLYLDGSLDDLDVNPLDKRLDERVRASVDEYLATHLDSLHSLVTALSEKVAFLEGAEAANQLPRSNTKVAIAKKEPEFWFIQQRAKHLGVEISANQRMKVEMWANESYKERHGELPKKQLYRGTQASVYPAKDIDILDTTIKGVVRGG